MRGILFDVRVLVLCLLSIAGTDCLRCWHCIADDCAMNPSDNYKASEKMCNPGQSCQKVFFEMVEETRKGNEIHKSTVRGCSADCMERNDFLNCTEEVKITRGCVRKDCCNDGDLCNSSNVTHTAFTTLFNIVIFSLCLFHFNIPLNVR